jgi:uncharacterized protein YjbI with pentapeptide repeats
MDHLRNVVVIVAVAALGWWAWDHATYRDVLRLHSEWLNDNSKGERANFADRQYIYKWCDLGLANFAGADLRQANLTAANFARCNFTGADLRGAMLTGTRLVYANLTGADLRGAILAQTELYEADLDGANLSGTDLSMAYLDEATLRDADTEGTIFPTQQLFYR